MKNVFPPTARALCEVSKGIEYFQSHLTIWMPTMDNAALENLWFRLAMAQRRKRRGCISKSQFVRFVGIVETLEGRARKYLSGKSSVSGHVAGISSSAQYEYTEGRNWANIIGYAGPHSVLKYERGKYKVERYGGKVENCDAVQEHVDGVKVDIRLSEKTANLKALNAVIRGIQNDRSFIKIQRNKLAMTIYISAHNL